MSAATPETDSFEDRADAFSEEMMVVSSECVREMECSRDAERAAHAETRRLLKQCVDALRNAKKTLSSHPNKAFFYLSVRDAATTITAATAHLKQLNDKP